MNKMSRLLEVSRKSSRRIIGLMSGMSMDGVDLALVNISGRYPDLKITLEDADYSPYPPELIEKLRCISHTSSTSNHPTGLLSQANFEVAICFSDLVNSFLKKKKISSDEVDAIGSHGQTVYHSTSDSDPVHSTLQIGSGSLIAQRTGILTVYNFRERDLAANGLGAPLVPLVDYLLFRETASVKTYTNLGSIANVTLIPEKSEDVLAFDIGPANMPIDFFVRKIPGDTIGYDRDSYYSLQGKVIEPMLRELLSHEFFLKLPPKSLGFREFGHENLEVFYNKYFSDNHFDLVRTAVELCAESVAQGFNNFVIPEIKSLGYSSLKECVFTGGGSKNKLLIDRFSSLLPGIPVSALSESDSKFSDAKEALAFAVLANELLSGRAGSLPKVTGVEAGTLLGCICP